MASISEELDVFEGVFGVCEGFTDSLSKAGVGEAAATGGAGVVLYAEGLGELYLREASSSLDSE